MHFRLISTVLIGFLFFCSSVLYVFFLSVLRIPSRDSWFHSFFLSFISAFTRTHGNNLSSQTSKMFYSQIRKANAEARACPLFNTLRHFLDGGFRLISSALMYR